MAIFPAGESITLEEVKSAYTYFKDYLCNLVNNSKEYKTV